jgi:hypothetical protein
LIRQAIDETVAEYVERLAPGMLRVTGGDLLPPPLLVRIIIGDDR